LKKVADFRLAGREIVFSTPKIDFPTSFRSNANGIVFFDGKVNISTRFGQKRIYSSKSDAFLAFGVKFPT